MKSTLAFAILSSFFCLLGTSAHATCVTFYDAGGYWIAVNNSSQSVYVRWQDQGNCSGGCGANIGGYQRQSVNGMRGRYSWRETSN